MVKLIKKLYDFYCESNLSLSDLGKKINVNPATISYWFSEKKQPSMKNEYRIKKFLKNHGIEIEEEEKIKK